MNRRILTNALRSIMIVAIAAVIAVSPVIAGRQAVRADTTTTVPTPTISVSGTGKVTVKPNLATINFGMFTHADTAAAAQSENDAAIAKITAALKAAGIKEENIQTTAYSLQPHYTWDKENEKNVLDGYDMSHNLNVIVRTIG
ncbi:MAG TPA: SIMPL domain-containing protein, partial [Candidatus Cryosericum sp.]